jgi:predicted aldo/keto reductase-like oxidoreductase
LDFLLQKEAELSDKRMTLGRTGLIVNRLGFGGIPLQRVEEAEAKEVVRHAIDQGIDFIDTARGYTTSERRIGLALKETDKKVALASKSALRTAEEMRAEVEKSLADLQVDHIDLYQCHFVKDEAAYAQIIGPGGALEALKQAREEGLIGHIGLTSHSLDVLKKVIADGLFETIMVCFGILEPKAKEEVIPQALDKGMGVLAMKPFAGGVLDQAEVALKYALSEPGVLVLAGVEHKEFLDQNWAVFNGDWSLDEADFQTIEALRQEFDKSFCRRCDYCQPCTEDIQIQVVLGLPSQVKRMGPEILGRSPRKDELDKARNCSECGECMTRCPYDLPIPDLLKERIEWADKLLASIPNIS